MAIRPPRGGENEGESSLLLPYIGHAGGVRQRMKLTSVVDQQVLQRVSSTRTHGQSKRLYRFQSLELRRR